MKSDLLRAERIQHGWSQAKLAEELGVDPRTVRRWERGQAIPFPYYRQKLSTLFGKSPEELGLPSDTDENDTIEVVSPSAPPSQPESEIATLPSFLADPAIPQTLDKTDNTKSLLGRDRLLEHIKEQLLAGNHLAFTALHGLPGSGKTALAATLANDPQIQNHFSDGILWVGLGQQPNVLGELARWGRLFGVSPTEVENIKSWEAWGRAIRAAIGTRHLLIILDDVWSVEDTLAFQVGGSQCCHLLTTRLSRIAFTFAQHGSIFIPPLEETDGLALLARFVPEVVEQEFADAKALVQALEGLPLALTLMGNYLTFLASIGQPQPIRTALAKLNQTEQYLHISMANFARDRSTNPAEIMPLCLHAALALSDQRLSQQAHATLHTLTILSGKPSSFSEEEAMAISQQPIETLDELWGAGLLESAGQGRYSLPQAVINYVRTQNKVSIAPQQLPTAQASDVQQVDHQEVHSLIASLSLSLFHWRSSSQKGGDPTVWPFKRVLPRPFLLIVSIALITILIISSIIIPQILIDQASYKSTPVETFYSPPQYPLNLQNTDPSLNDIANHLQYTFNAVYPELVNRFALYPYFMSHNIVTIILTPNISSPIEISGTMITINSDWLRQHPNDTGLLTHALTLLVQNYPSNASPSWFSDGMADYARSVYGPADDDWSLPNTVQPQESYTQGGGVTARFLLWLEQHTKPDIVDQLNRAVQTEQSLPTAFYDLTHSTLEQSWRQYQAHPDITVTPQQIYKIVTSRKPIYYQPDSKTIQCSQQERLHIEFLQGVYISNFAVQTNMTFVAGDGGGGIMFRFENSNQYRFHVSPDGSYNLVSQSKPLLSGFSQTVRQGLNQTNQLTIIAQKQTIYLYINGQFIAKTDDNSSSYGTIGEMAYDKTTSTDVRFEKTQVF